MYLELVNSPADIKKLDHEELSSLAAELRELIIKQVSVSGGHLASNLGVVELTIALHHVFDSPKDKLVWDVGHQCYAHKIITGRKDKFHTLRKAGGLSGFPKPEESPHDAFSAGHSSTSISAALGLLEAMRIKGEPHKAVAIIGDGSLTAGLSFEGLNHAGQLGRDLIVVLNDNEMSISKNVGALSVYLNRLLTGQFYQRLKVRTKEVLEGIPKVGTPFSKLAQMAEDGLKGAIMPGMLFEELGFNYIGPVDGHNIKVLLDTFRRVRELKGPLLVHVVTKKGKGYTRSEEDPCVFHGIGPFDPVSGEPLSKGMSMSDLFGQALSEVAAEDPLVVAVTAAMKEGTGLASFAQRYPDRLYDVGIAEPHAVVFAAGLAKGGMKPVVAIYSTFLQRAYDQVIHDVCLQGLPVVFAIDRGGAVGEDGPTHHGVFDLSFLRHIPNLTLMAPRDAGELKAMLRLAVSLGGPLAIRYPRGKAAGPGSQVPVQYGKAELLREGAGAAILAIGNRAQAAMQAAEALAGEGVDALVYNMRFVKPLDLDALRKAAATGTIVTVEDNAAAGGFGGAVSEALSETGNFHVKVKHLGYPDRFIEHAAQSELRKRYGIDKNGIVKAVKGLLQ